MVKLTAESIERKCSQIQLRKSLSKQLKKDELCALTHLRMNDMFVSSIGNLAVYKNLKVIYLQNNNISKIENLHFATHLTHLYLQHNAIKKIENLNALRNLHTLHLGHNNIAILEGLEELQNLTVLHIEYQNIPNGEPLCFDPRSMQSLSRCLKTLNISGNRISSLKGIQHLQALQVLDAKSNNISDIEDLTEFIIPLKSLRELHLQDNPVVTRYRYKENLIANSESLQNINGKAVTDACRSFMRKFKLEKHLWYTRRTSKTTVGEDITSSMNLPPAFKRSISRALFQQSGPKLCITVSSVNGEVQPQVFPAWKTAPGACGVKGNHIRPRPFWSNITKTKSARTLNSLINDKAIALPPL